MSAMQEILEAINIPFALGIFFAVFAVVVSTKISEVGLRDYLLTLVLAILATCAAIDLWLPRVTPLYDCIVGFAVGFIANDVYVNLKLTVPDFVKKVIGSTLEGVSRWLDKFIGRK